MHTHTHTHIHTQQQQEDNFWKIGLFIAKISQMDGKKVGLKSGFEGV